MSADGLALSYEDHPAPSVALVALQWVTIGIFAYLTASMLRDAPIHRWTDLLRPDLLLFGATVVIMAYYFWPFYATFYTLSTGGLEVRYGPWTHVYAWDDFERAEWKRGFFASRIGWPSTTPCVRMWNGIRLKRRNRWLGLYLTPSDPAEFLRKLGEFAPQLSGGAPGGTRS